VTKKIYQYYLKANLKKSSGSFDELLNYPLFSILLFELFNKGTKAEKLIFFNTILKLNDLLVSILKDLSTPIELYLTKISLEKEKILYNKVKRDEI